MFVAVHERSVGGDQAAPDFMGRALIKANVVDRLVRRLPSQPNPAMSAANEDRG